MFPGPLFLLFATAKKTTPFQAALRPLNLGGQRPGYPAPEKPLAFRLPVAPPVWTGHLPFL